MYLYVHAETELDDLPDDLLKLVKQLTHVMDLELNEQRPLARVNVLDVMGALEDKGYFIQMPPENLKPELHFGD